MYVMLFSRGVLPEIKHPAIEHRYLVLGGEKVFLGASKAFVMALFEDVYGINMVDQGDALTLWKPTRHTGDISLRNGCVVKIHKRWSDYYADEEGIKTFQSLYGLFTDFTDVNGLFKLSHFRS